MAATLTLKAASPYALKYEYNYDGLGGANSEDITVTQAQMLSDSVAGPLRDALTAADTDPEWTALPDSAAISLYVTPTGGAGLTNWPAADFVLVPGRVVRASSTTAVATRGYVEIRFNHTYDR